VKARDLLHLLGWKSRPRVYGHEVRTFDLSGEGRVDYAQWLHPGETAKVIRQDVVDHLRTFLRPGDVAIDVGAHSGDSTLPMALAVGPGGRVLALEPNPYVFPVLARNAALNPEKTAIVPLNFAATTESGAVEFEYSDAGFCNGGRHEGISRWRHGHAFRLKVRGERLGPYLTAHHPDLVGRLRYVKVDAEGYDLSVLESIADLIDQVRPFIRAEVFKLTPNADRQRLFTFFERRDYVVHHVDSETDYRGEVITGADMLRWPHFDCFAVPGPKARASRLKAQDQR
jgi:FkbM family methyltransferase